MSFMKSNTPVPLWQGQIEKMMFYLWLQEEGDRADTKKREKVLLNLNIFCVRGENIICHFI
jgi:hypothetical protein